jgi:hypothetical protein
MLDEEEARDVDPAQAETKLIEGNYTFLRSFPREEETEEGGGAVYSGFLSTSKQVPLSFASTNGKITNGHQPITSVPCPRQLPIPYPFAVLSRAVCAPRLFKVLEILSSLRATDSGDFKRESRTQHCFYSLITRYTFLNETVR